MSKNADENPLQTCYTNIVESMKVIYKTKCTLLHFLIILLISFSLRQ